jgi:hypothetical protein
LSLRKLDDPVPFDLRDAITGKVRSPTSNEWKLILSVFPECTGYRIADPILVLQFPTPPKWTPTTVGVLPTVYIRDMRLYNHISGTPRNRKLEDFGGDFAIEDGRLPTFETLERAFKLFASHVQNITTLRYRHNHWVVGVSQSFDPQQMPGTFGRRLVTYTSGDVQTQYSRPQLSTPNNGQFDQTDYRAFGLSPGVKVVGLSMATTSGVLVKNEDGRRRLTLANRGFHDTCEVHHPDIFPDFRLGSVVERYPLLDIALADIQLTLFTRTRPISPSIRLVVSSPLSKQPILSPSYRGLRLKGCPRDASSCFILGPVLATRDCRPTSLRGTC